MNAPTIEELAAGKAVAPRNETSWIRVGMDTGSIAAGSRSVQEALVEECKRQGFHIPIYQTGSWGYCHADPVLRIQCHGWPPITFGNMTPDSARALVNSHCRNLGLLDDHVMVRPYNPPLKEAPPPTVLVVQDTDESEEDRTHPWQKALRTELACLGLADSVSVYRALDMGLHNRGLCVHFLPSGRTYTNLQPADLPTLLKECQTGHITLPAKQLTGTDPQQRVVLRNCGSVDPDELSDALAAGTYRGFASLLQQQDPETALDQLRQSGLRGRGGAGFPTHLKWRLTRQPVADRKFVICNADEGDPGAFMDRSVLESDPHAVLEGLLIAAFSIGASNGFFYIRAEYPLAVKRVQRAIDQARAAGLLGHNILGTDFSFNAEIRLGAGAFVCGEETALIASIEGRRGSPEPRPPYPSVSGLWGYPTCINNVETLAAVSAIFTHGPESFASMGTDQSKGTKVFAVTGKIHQSQLVEVPMGTPLRTVIHDICGGTGKGTAIKGVQTGGPSGGVIPDRLLDTPISYESLKELGSIMGSGGMLVMDEQDSMVDVAKFYLQFCVDESCGKCAPCRVGGYQMLQILEKIFKGRGREEELRQLRDIAGAMQCASLCGLGQTAPNPVLSTLRYFEEEYREFIEGGPTFARRKKKELAAASA